MSYLLALGAVLLAGAGGVVWARRQWMVVTVEGNSMSPTLHHGQRVVARRLHGSGHARSDIIVFLLTPEQREAMAQGDDPVHRVKRVAAVAGDAVPDWAREALGADEHTRVPPGKVVVSADNAGRSQDSRQLGYIDASTIIGVVRQSGFARDIP
ncbi:S26 family signal peptidase [Corallococcus sicarius]|uniref:Signal peptidase I n=1 Tax=Corallococcus sicarius TaxID=2316726 RepID=A0A3A8P3D4_9BACT|nr:S26 family signal peptidase [Corallococcus sicarius]RKH46922.1 S26 family signal peptidase [Corallococcus sicarius]